MGFCGGGGWGFFLVEGGCSWVFVCSFVLVWALVLFLLTRKACSAPTQGDLEVLDG